MLLIQSSREQEDLVSDARFSLNGIAFPTNVDVVWVVRPIKHLEMLESKLHPDNLLQAYFTREYEGHDHAWRKSKLYMMLQVHTVLTEQHWQVRLYLTTLQSRGYLDSYLAGQSPPDVLKVCAVEDLCLPFPPSKAL